MTQTVLVSLIIAVFGCFGTIVGSYFGVRASNKLTNYRLDELTEQVHRHNNVIERTFKLESASLVLTEKLNVANHRIEDLEKEKRK